MKTIKYSNNNNINNNNSIHAKLFVSIILKKSVVYFITYVIFNWFIMIVVFFKLFLTVTNIFMLITCKLLIRT